MRLRALREIPSNGKIAFGPLLFSVDADGVLDPQPTDLQVSSMKLEVYLKWVERADVAEPEKKPDLPVFNFAVKPSEPKTPNLIVPVEDEDEDDDNVFVDILPAEIAPAPAPVVASKAATEDYSKLTAAELRDLCDAFEIKYPSNATKAKLVELLKGA
jgi:hypothetical protein